MSDKNPDRYHHGDLRRTLLVAAERLIRTDGVDHVSLRAIAKIAGVSHAAPYHHFDDLEGLLAAVAASGFSRLREAMMDRAVAAEEPPLGRLQEAGVAYVRFAADNPELYRLMFSGRLARSREHAELLEASGAAYAALGELLGRANTASGQAGQTGGNPAERAAWSMVHGFAMLIIDGRVDLDRNDTAAVEKAARDVTAVLGRGLRAL